MQSRENRENNLSESYDHTFYFFEVPQNNNDIGEDGWRHVSKRRVTRPGTAYGFVLDGNGNCIAKDTLVLRQTEP